METEMMTHFSVLAWRIPWTEELGRLQSIGSQRVRHNGSNVAHVHTHIINCCKLSLKEKNWVTKNTNTLKCQKVYAPILGSFSWSASFDFSFMRVGLLINEIFLFNKVYIFVLVYQFLESYLLRTKMIICISKQMTKYFFFIWSRKLWQNVLLLLMVSMVVKLKNLSFSFISCDKIYEMKFITSFTTSKMLPTTPLLQLQPFLLFKICTKFYWLDSFI